MNKDYIYSLGDIVWTIQDDTNLVEAWTVKQVFIIVTSTTIVKYVLAGKRGSFVFLEDDIYATLSDALAVLI